MSKLFSPKLFSLLKNGLERKQIFTDVKSGIAVGIVALPLAIAFAVASGVSPEKGIISSIIGGFIISLFGGSRVQIGGATGVVIVIVYSIVETYGFNGLVISTIMAGIILIIFGCLRLGTLLKYFPQPLVVGSTSGIALVIFSTQIKDTLGLDIAKVPTGFLTKWELYLDQIHTFNPSSIILTLATILIIVYSNKFSTKIPGSILSIVGITLFVQIFNLPVTTIESFFGNITNQISFSLPYVEWNTLPQYIAPAMTLALLGAMSSLLSAVVTDGMIGGNHRSNTELITQGLANIVTPLFGGIPVTGAIARTATNVKNGGRSPIAGMIHSLILLLIMLFLGKWTKLIPMSCLAGVLIVVSYNMSEWRVFYSILKSSAFDIVVLLSTFFLTVLVDLTVAIEVGIVLSAILFMKRMSDKGEEFQKEVNDDLIEDYSDLPKAISVYEISGPFFFASAKQYAELIHQIGIKSEIIVIRMRHVPFIDATGFHNFKSVIQNLQNSNVTIILSGVNASVLLDMKKHDMISKVGEDHIFDSFNHALDYAKATLN